MLLQEITNEQAYLQNLWNKRRSDGKIAYVSKVGWWVLRNDVKGYICDAVFLGRYIQDAQQSLKDR